MLVELIIHPQGEGARLGDALEHVIGLVARSGLPHERTPAGTRIEGDSVAVWDLLRRCHESLPEECGPIVTEVRIDFTEAQTSARAAEPDRQAAEPDRQAAEPDRQAAEPDRQAAEPDGQAAEPGGQGAGPGAGPLVPLIASEHPARDPTYPCACQGLGCVSCLGEACP